MSASRTFWLVVGSPENWHTAFDYGGIWGLRRSQERYWNRMEENRDLIFFYVTAPVSGIVGHGLVRTKLHQLSPLWPEERAKNEVVWPLRFEFEVISCLPPDVWQTGRIEADELKSRVRSGFQELESTLAAKIMALLPSSVPGSLVMSPSLVAQDRLGAPDTVQRVPSDDSHKRTQLLLSEIGSLQKFIAQIEVPLENRRVDVVWRKVQRSAPSYVFEVQVSGNITEAIAKLKQAYELWNSHIFLVGKPEHRSASQQLCDGAFREIRERMRFIELVQVEELHKRKRAYRDYEDQIGIFG
ncbi:MAG TPA: hypothetical protein VMD77_03930 [Candidatus Baltobacteraceae bacterium]|jgi:hypothetical protein|nr:hypothetical protein [Candidatus Baltobacteraceae bacterium]